MSTTPKEIVLQEPEDFENKSFVIPQPGRNSKYTVMTLMKGLILFRGEHTERREPGREVPAFFADLVSASIYTRGDPDRLFGFRVKKAPKLFLLSYSNLARLLEDDRLTAEELEILNQYLQVEEDLPPYIVPISFYKKADAEGENKLYLNRRVINLICRLGYDGWVVMPESVIQRNLDARHYKETGQMRYTLNPYNPEVAVCSWNNFLEPLK